MMNYIKYIRLKNASDWLILLSLLASRNFPMNIFKLLVAVKSVLAATGHRNSSRRNNACDPLSHPQIARMTLNQVADLPMDRC
jgi:hypothetical protein